MSKVGIFNKPIDAKLMNMYILLRQGFSSALLLVGCALLPDFADGSYAPSTDFPLKNIVKIEIKEATEAALTQAINAATANRIVSIAFAENLAGKTITLSAALPIIQARYFNITGPNKKITIDGAGRFNIFQFVPSMNVNGLVTVRNFIITHAGSSSNYAISSINALLLDNVSILDNGVNGADGEGGVRAHQGLYITNSVISGNKGGGVKGGPITIESSTIKDNVVMANEYNGAGIDGTDIIVNNSTISDNFTESTVTFVGGGITGSSITINNSTISGNRATYAGGGINGDFIDIKNSTVTKNSAATGGGIYTEGKLVIKNTILAQNGNVTGIKGVYDDIYVQHSKQLSSEGHNLIGIPRYDSWHMSDIILNTGAPMLNPLADNGGPTMTHALLPNSPAIRKGICVSGQKDQRGVVRKVPDCDIGAYETNK